MNKTIEKNWLFICSKNQWRSPTAERIFAEYDGIQTRSAGILSSARHTLNANDILWATHIFCMEDKHKTYVTQNFRDHIKSQSIIVLDIPDEFKYMDEELVNWLEQALLVWL